MPTINTTADARLRLDEYLSRRCGVLNLSKPFLCLNPAHDDHHPSMVYYANAKSGHVAPHVYCESCQARGDVFTVAGWVIGSDDFKVQLSEVESVLGLNLRGKRGDSRRPRPQAKQVPPYPVPRKCENETNVIGVVQDAFFGLYEPEGSKALSYLHSRGFDEAIICNNGVGWVQHPRKIFPESCADAPGSHGGWIVLPFRHDDEWSSCLYCVFRRLTQPGCKGFKEYKPKGLTQPLYNEHLLLSGEESPVFVVEGIFDALSLQMLDSGAKVISLMGTGGANRLLSVLYYARPEQRPSKLVLALDQDDGGCRATQRLRDGLLSMRVPFSIAPPFPNGAKDANEYLMSLEAVSA